MPFSGNSAELKIVRTGWLDVRVEWRIRDFLSLPHTGYFSYESLPFSFDGAHWYLVLFLDGLTETQTGWMALGLCRKGLSTETFHVSVGVKGSEGTEKRRERIKECSENDSYYWEDFCSRSELLEHGSRMMTDGVLTITCVVKKTAREKDLLEKEVESLNEQINTLQERISSYELESENNQKKISALESEKLSIEEQYKWYLEEKIAIISDFERATFHDDKKDKNRTHEGDEVSKIEKEVNRVKSTKKISLPTRHDDVIRSLKSILAEGSRADFTLKCGGGEWPVHRAILEGRGGHIESILQGAQGDEARLDDVMEDAMEVVLQFLYAGEVEDVCLGNVCAVHAAAHELNLEDLKSLCAECMKEWMCPELVCGALIVAERYKEGDLKEKALDYYFRESNRVVVTEGWKELKKYHPSIIGDLLQEFVKRQRMIWMKVQD